MNKKTSTEPCVKYVILPAKPEFSSMQMDKRMMRNASLVDWRKKEATEQVDPVRATFASMSSETGRCTYLARIGAGSRSSGTSLSL